MRLAVRQHLHVLDGHGTQTLYHNAVEPVTPWLKRTAPDLCILHTTFLGVRWNDDFERYRARFAWVADLDCPKIALPQDEYDHSEVLEEWLLELGASRVYSCFGRDQRATLYPNLEDRLPFEETLTGFIHEDAAAAVAARMVPHADRPWDIVYRAPKLPYWFGSHGQLKHRIAGIVEDRARELGFSTDISTRWEDTIFGERWLDFVMSGRAIIGCESGSSVLDGRGEIQQRIRRLLAARPDLSFEEVDAQMRDGWDAYSYFAISPRHLEAVITKTAQLLVEGTYSGVLEPETHYIPLRRDFSNLAEALERLRDRKTVEAMTERAYRDVYLNGANTLGGFAEQLLAEPPRRARKVAVPFALAKRIPTPHLPESVPRTGCLRPLSLGLTLVDGLAREPEARRLLVRAARGNGGLSLKDAAREVILLRVLTRIRRDGGEGKDWWLSAENAAGTLTIETQVGAPVAQEIELEQPFETVVWKHSAVAEAAPLFPRRPRWGWISVGAQGKYEFKSLGDARTDDEAARGLLERTLEGGDRS